MKKKMAAIFGIIMAITLVSFSFVYAESKSVKTQQFTGVVKDVKADVITLAKGKKELSLVITSDTSITINKQKQPVSMIEPGNKAKAKYIERDGKLVAKSISVKSAKVAQQ